MLAIIAAKPPEGIGADIETIKRLIDHDPEALSAMTEALRRDIRANRYDEEGVYNINTLEGDQIPARPSGASKDPPGTSKLRNRPYFHKST